MSIYIYTPNLKLRHWLWLGWSKEEASALTLLTFKHCAIVDVFVLHEKIIAFFNYLYRIGGLKNLQISINVVLTVFIFLGS